MTLVVTKQGQTARRISSSGVPEETFLQEYVVANPDALPLEDLRENLQLVVFAREFQTSHGPLDAVAIDDEGEGEGEGEGEVYVIDTKLYKNPDKRRVIAQLLDYGAALWHDFPDPAELRNHFESASRQTLGIRLSEKLEQFLGATDEEREAILDHAANAISDGRVRFIVLKQALE